MRFKLHQVWFMVVWFCLPLATGAGRAGEGPTPAERVRLAAEVRAKLDQLLACWYPRCVDAPGRGFKQNFSREWNEQDDGLRSLVFQARMTWVAAQAARRYPDAAATYTQYARQGAAFLRERMWDPDRGGFHWAVDLAKGGAPATPDKHVYGNAFAIYALTAAYQVTHDEADKAAALATFKWLEQHAHDARDGGYFEALDLAGQPRPRGYLGPNGGRNDQIGTLYGYKSMNTHIHLLEAFAALAPLFPEQAEVRTRLTELLGLVRDKIAVEPGCLNLYFTPDWRALPDHDSFGHDVETGYLLLEAEELSRRPADARTAQVARQLVDHALTFGWDEQSGGLYDAGGAFRSLYVTDKIWWVQYENLNALCLMFKRHGQADGRYWPELERQWFFIKTHLWDQVFGGSYGQTDQLGRPQSEKKGTAWKAAYHEARALLNVSDWLAARP